MCIHTSEEMGDESSSATHLSVAMTPYEGESSQTTAGSGVTSSKSRGTVYFEIAVVIIGVLGTVANGLVVYALVASKQHRKHALIVNQNALDLYSSIFRSISQILLTKRSSSHRHRHKTSQPKQYALAALPVDVICLVDFHHTCLKDSQEQRGYIVNAKVTFVLLL